VASFTLNSNIPSENLLIALNHTLPQAIRVTAIEEVQSEFHARHSAKAKTYEYRIFRSSICPPFIARYVHPHPYPLDEEAMTNAAALVVGEHDFTTFAAVDPERGKEDLNASCVRTIYSSVWRREGDLFIYRVRGNGFLHHMVRNLVGTFLLVGKGSVRPESITEILASRCRSEAGPTAPASGLFLVDVEY
jgi:tRNA pseudouridine38-40 synthase